MSFSQQLSDGFFKGLSTGYLFSALILGLVTMSGWLVTNWLNRRERLQNYYERRDDMQKAIYSEIWSNVLSLEENDLDDHARQVIRLMEDMPDFVPFVPKDTRDVVFQALLPNIHYLPKETIDVVTEYYQLNRQITDMIEDMRSESYAALSVERRAAIYSDYIAIKKRTLELGREALFLIALYAERGASSITSYWEMDIDSRKNAIDQAMRNAHEKRS